MVVQTLSVNRLIFLERVGEDHRVHEVDSYRCLLSDIDERRRDYLRAPYSDAIKNHGPIHIPANHPYLKTHTEETEEQYLVPLNFAGTILGFWAFGITPANRAAIPNFLSIVRDFANVIGELLYNRNEIQLKETKIHNFRRFLAREREKETQEALTQTIELFKHQFDNISRVFYNLNTRTVVFDLFGRVLEINGNMIEFLKGEGLAPYNMTLLDLFSTLTHSSIDEVRQFMRTVITERKTVSFLVNKDNKNFIVNLKPLEFKSGLQTRLDPAPFGVNGIVCELTETTSMIRLHEVREQLAEHLSSSLQAELDSVVSAVLLLEKTEYCSEQQRQYLHSAKTHLKNALISIDRCQNYLVDTGKLINFSSAFPINPDKALSLAANELAAGLREKQVKVEIVRQAPNDYVLALPEFLYHVFLHILTILLADTRNQGQITVSISVSLEYLSFKFQDTGFGIPNEKLQEQMFGNNIENLSANMHNIRESCEWIRSWGGSIVASSEVGTGMTITVNLVRFH